jgi:hypothetical protein
MEGDIFPGPCFAVLIDDGENQDGEQGVQEWMEKYPYVRQDQSPIEEFNFLCCDPIGDESDPSDEEQLQHRIKSSLPGPSYLPGEESENKHRQ